MKPPNPAPQAASPPKQKCLQEPRAVREAPKPDSCWDIVDENSWGSFPASDPPGFAP